MTDRFAQQLQAVNQAFSERESDILARLNSALADLALRNEQCDRLAQQAEDLRHELALAEQAIRSLQSAQADLAGARAATDSLTLERDRLHQALRAQESAAADLMQRHMDEVQRQTRDHAAQLVAMQQRALQSKEEMGAALQRQMAQVQAEHKATRDALDQRYADMLASHQREIATLRQRIDQHQQELVAREEAHARALLGATTAATTAAVDNMTRHHAELLRERQAQVESVRAELDAARTQLAQREQRLGALEAALGALVPQAIAVRGLQQATWQAWQLERQRLLQDAAARERALLASSPGQTHPHPPSPATAPAAAAATAPATTLPADPMTTATAAAASLQELLALHDSRFVAAVYLTVLRRPVDDEGLSNYLRHLREGMSKAELIAALARSPEGQAANCRLPGLDELVASTTRTPATWLGRLFKRAAVDGQQDLGRQLTRMENQLGRLMLETGDRLGRLEGAVADLRRQSDHHQQALVDMLAASQAAAATLATAMPGRGSQPQAAASATADEVPWSDDVVERARRLLQPGQAS